MGVSDEGVMDFGWARLFLALSGGHGGADDAACFVVELGDRVRAYE